VTKPILSGVCGSDAKLVLGDFNTGDIDNPMAAFSSLPHVPGHEVVAEVVELGPQANGLDVGQRVVLNPWLTCGPRGIDPMCPPCQAGDLSLCWSFTKGDLGPGVHVGVITAAPGAWAERLAAHDSMLIPVPDGVSDEAAVLADPFSVSFHAIVRHPPPPNGRVLVYGAGALGLTSVAILHALYPGVEVGVVARFEAQREMALRFGASAVFSHEPRLALVEELAAWSGAVLHLPLDGLPVTHPGHIDVVYDSIAKAETLEVGVRVLAERGRLVYTGVATPERWESTPIYFKEITIAGSNAFGIEDFEGTRRHAIAHYLQLVADGRLDITPMLTHRFALEEWWPALKALARQDRSGALKVAFTPNG
jgi:threonine dehydrogenase-like Zn-dependent dehydrogenase